MYILTSCITESVFWSLPMVDVTWEPKHYIIYKKASKCHLTRRYVVFDGMLVLFCYTIFSIYKSGIPLLILPNIHLMKISTDNCVIFWEKKALQWHLSCYLALANNTLLSVLWLMSWKKWSMLIIRVRKKCMLLLSLACSNCSLLSYPQTLPVWF